MASQKMVSVAVRVLDKACFDAAADALEARGMLVLERRSGPSLIIGEIASSLLPQLALVVGCTVLG